MGNLFFTRRQEDEQKCLVCDQLKTSGIHLLNYYICQQCENEITTTNVKEKNYRHYFKRLKKVKTL